MESAALIHYCQEQTEKIIHRAESLKTLPIQNLKWKASSESWSVLECLEHLNLYAEFYNPAVKLAIKNSTSIPERHFKSGFLGAYFAKSMLPNEKMNKMKTFKDKNPVFSQVSSTVLDDFINQQKEFLTLLESAKTVNIGKVKTPITITKWIKLKLGDTLQFLVNHNIRHMSQVERCLKQQE